MPSRPALLAVVLAALCGLGPAQAQTQTQTQTASTLAYQAANAAMHAAMGIAYTGDADVDFAAGMIPHHQGAIDMAQVELQFGTDPQLRAMAQVIMASQGHEIVHMASWLARNAPATATPTPVPAAADHAAHAPGAAPAAGPMPDMPGMNHGAAPAGDQGPSSQAYAAANARMHGAMDVAFTDNADIDFARGMIPHHQGAIDMAEVEVTYGDDPGMVGLAQTIVTGQGAEIRILQDWLAAHGG